MKKFFLISIVVFHVTLWMGFIGLIAYLDFFGLDPIHAGALSACAAGIEIVSFLAVLSVLNDPKCSWKLLCPEGNELASDSGDLRGNDNARAYSKAQAVNACNALGYCELSGAPVRFLVIAGNGESISSRWAFWCLRKEYFVTLKLTKLPLTQAQAKELREKNLARKLDEEKKAEEKLLSLFEARVASLINGAHFETAVKNAVKEVLGG